MKNMRPLIKSDQATFSLRDTASVWFRHKLLITVTFLTIAGGTILTTFMLPNEYESRLKILVKNVRAEVLITPERTTGANGASNEDVSETQINSEIELLTSKDLLNQVVTECGLVRQGRSLAQRLSLKDVPQNEAGRIEQASERLAKDLVITPVKKANIIEITYSSSSPQVAAAVLRKLADLYLEKRLKLHRPAGTYEFFKSQADQYEQQLREAEKQLSSFQQGMNVVSLSQQKDLTVLKMTDSKSKLLETEAFLKEVNERINLLEQQMRTLQPRIVTQSRALPNQYSAERLNTMLVELQNRRTQLLRRVKEAEDNYQLYEKKQEESRIADEMDQNKITNVSLAEAPVQSQLPSKPNRPLNLLLGLVMGVLVSLGCAITAEFFRESIETPRELELSSGSQVLATIPKLARGRGSLIIDKRRLLTAGSETASDVNVA